MITSSSKDSWGAFFTFLTLAGFPCEKVGQFRATCPFFLHLKQSPFFIQCSLSSFESLATLIASTSIAFGSLVGVAEVAANGR